MEEKYRSAHGKVFRSVVSVEVLDVDSKRIDHFVGSVLLNSPTSTFIFSPTKIESVCTLRVHFSDTTAKEAKVFATGPVFSILIMPNHNAAEPINLRENPVEEHEDVLILAPTQVDASLAVLDGSVIAPSCYGKNLYKMVVDSSDQYFFLTCTFHDKGVLVKDRITSSPVFDLNGDCVGFLFASCGQTSGARFVKSVFHARGIAGIVSGMQKRINGQLRDCTVTDGLWKDTLLALESEQQKGR